MARETPGGRVILVYRGRLGKDEREALEEGRWAWTEDASKADLAPPAGEEGNRPPPDSSGLTPREREVLEYLADGWSNEEIADRLRIRLATVKFHTGSIYRTLGVSRRTEAVREAQRRGLIEW